MNDKVVDYYFAPVSPWTYLGHERFVALLQANAATCRLSPVDLSKVFPVSGGLPLPKRAPQRQAYRLVELARWSDWLQLPINVTPKFGASSGDLASRWILAAAGRSVGSGLAMTGGVLRARWAEERDIADPATLADQRRGWRRVSYEVRGTPGALYDIGVGPKSEWRKLALAYPRMRVCGCEPHPAQHEALRKAKFPGPLVKAAIGEQEGVATLHVPTHDLKCCSLLAVPYANTTCEVEVWTLDRFDRQMGCPDRILLWLDVEGSELSALRSGPRLLASGRIRWINLEERRNGHCPASGW